MSELLYKLEAFEGPLDLLLHLIQKHKLNIHDIKISELLAQYMAQIELMRENNLDISSEFLEMASRLVYIKTVSLLPKQEEVEKLKQELTGQLLEYQECKEMAKLMAQKINLDFIARAPTPIDVDFSYKLKHKILELQKFYVFSVGRNKGLTQPKKEAFSYIVSRKIVSVFSKTVCILRQLIKGNVEYKYVLKKSKNKSELVATFLATLELIKTKRIIMEKGLIKLNFKEGKYWKSKRQKQQ